jgi:hypothetical protein
VGCHVQVLEENGILIADEDKVLADRVFRNMSDQIALLRSIHGEGYTWLK